MCGVPSILLCPRPRRPLRAAECGITAAGVKALLRALEGVASLPRIKLDGAQTDIATCWGDAHGFPGGGPP